MTTGPARSACPAVPSAALRTPASIITVPAASAAISRLRARNRRRSGGVSGGHSLTSEPSQAMRPNSAECPRGYLRHTEAAGRRHRRRAGSCHRLEVVKLTP